MTTGITSNGADLATIFGAKGTHTAAATGIKVNGTDLNQLLLALTDGVAVGATGIKVNGADLNTIFGAVSGTLPINGETFLAAAASATTSCSAGIQFNASTSGWSVTGSSSTGGHVDTASGSLPSGAVSVQYSYTLTTSVGNGSVTNSASSVTTLTSSNVSIAVVANSPSPSSADNERYATVVIKFYNASSALISTTTIYLHAQAEGTA